MKIAKIRYAIGYGLLAEFSGGGGSCHRLPVLSLIAADAASRCHLRKTSTIVVLLAACAAAPQTVAMEVIRPGDTLVLSGEIVRVTSTPCRPSSTGRP